MNASLSALGRVIAALARRDKYVSFRDSVAGRLCFGQVRFVGAWFFRKMVCFGWKGFGYGFVLVDVAT